LASDLKRFILVTALASLLALCFVVPVAAPASAEVNGPCQVTVNGQDVGPLSSSSTGDAIKVHKDDVLTVVMTTATGFASHKIDLELAGFKIALQDKPDSGDKQWSGTANVHDYARFGVGLYKIVGEGHLSDGSVCTGAVLIEVQGSGITSIVGIIATAIFIFGLLVLAGSSFGAMQRFGSVRRRVEAWAEEQAKRIASGTPVSQADLVTALREIARPRAPITLWMLATMPLFLLTGAIPAGGMIEDEGSAAVSGLLSLPRIGFRPGTSIAGSIGGAVATEAVVVLFQQFAISPLTRSNSIIGLGAGIVLAIVFTTGVRVWGGRHVNKAIGEAEQRLNAAIEQIRKEVGLPPTPPQLATEMGASGMPPVAEPPKPPEDGGLGEP
jgi:hypothetical protein